MGKKEWLLLLVSVVVTMALGLGLIRWLMPELIWRPVDLRLVGVAEKLPPFYEGVFRQESFDPDRFLINDPYTLVRPIPLFPDIKAMGPNDLLGFRNRAIPNTAQIVVIGDSQTYGNNAALEQNWPSRLSAHLDELSPSLYAMASGGWGAVQYLDMASNATLFSPRVIVVAFYAGNDPLDSFRVTYGVERWAGLRPDPGLSEDDLPEVPFPAPPETHWPVQFADGVSTVFTPGLRLASNSGQAAARAGWQVMEKVAGLISQYASAHKATLVVTVIPTKELVYARKVEHELLQAPGDYVRLVERESGNILDFEKALQALPGVRYVDLLTPLQQAAMGPDPLYAEDTNGHPVDHGYDVVALSIADVVKPLLLELPRGLMAMQYMSQKHHFLLVTDKGIWRLPNIKVAADLGWPMENIPVVHAVDLGDRPWLGELHSVDRQRFGPEAILNATPSPDR